MARRRYLIIFLTFMVIFLNYMDRVNFSVSIPAIRQEFGFDLHQIGEIAFVWGSLMDSLTLRAAGSQIILDCGGVWSSR
ncbi:hypothetical protein BX589_1322 [Paraburkholderia fungorum]|jgi:sugar phosphate permease|nr:hypothetical protein BX589_1322 [Paraburkholderia fungorum]